MGLSDRSFLGTSFSWSPIQSSHPSSSTGGAISPCIICPTHTRNGLNGGLSTVTFVNATCWLDPSSLAFKPLHISTVHHELHFACMSVRVLIKNVVIRFCCSTRPAPYVRGISAGRGRLWHRRPLWGCSSLWVLDRMNFFLDAHHILFDNESNQSFHYGISHHTTVGCLGQNEIVRSSIRSFLILPY